MKVRVIKPQRLGEDYGIHEGGVYEVATTKIGAPMVSEGIALIKIPGGTRTFVLPKGHWTVVELDGKKVAPRVGSSHAQQRGGK